MRGRAIRLSTLRRIGVRQVGQHSALFTALAVALLIALWPGQVSAPAPGPAATAAEIHKYTWLHLSYLHGGATCQTAQHLTYAREPGVWIADHWYVSSQLMADAALLRSGQPAVADLRCALLREYDYLEQLWNPDFPGGYFPRSDLDGRNPTTKDLYADDNALAGLAMLEAYKVTEDPELRARMLLGAERAADFLIQAGVWDETYAGGFWWNTERGESEGGKPTQTVGLAIQLFTRLHELTGRAHYRTWALAGLAWVESHLWDPVQGLYRFGFRPESARGPRLPGYVSYDQGIMIEAHLDVDRTVESHPRHLERARQLALRLERFRSPLGGYVFELGVPQVFSHYSAWASQGLLALYTVDRNPAWLEAARESLQAATRALQDPFDRGMFFGSYECIPAWAVTCPADATWWIDRRKLHLSQSWTQRGLALLEIADRAPGARN